MTAREMGWAAMVAEAERMVAVCAEGRRAWRKVEDKAWRRRAVRGRVGWATVEEAGSDGIGDGGGDSGGDGGGGEGGGGEEAGGKEQCRLPKSKCRGSLTH